MTFRINSRFDVTEEVPSPHSAQEITDKLADGFQHVANALRRFGQESDKMPDTIDLTLDCITDAWIVRFGTKEYKAYSDRSSCPVMAVGEKAEATPPAATATSWWKFWRGV